MMGEIVLSSKTIHQLPGYASKYLGRKTKIFVFIASIIGFYAALVAYLIGEGESLAKIIPIINAPTNEINNKLIKASRVIKEAAKFTIGFEKSDQTGAIRKDSA